MYYKVHHFIHTNTTFSTGGRGPPPSTPTPPRHMCLQRFYSQLRPWMYSSSPLSLSNVHFSMFWSNCHFDWFHRTTLMTRQIGSPFLHRTTLMTRQIGSPFLHTTTLMTSQIGSPFLHTTTLMTRQISSPFLILILTRIERREVKMELYWQK